jgi:hypothetical protein
VIEPIQEPAPGHVVRWAPADAAAPPGVRLARLPESAGPYAFYLAGDDGSVWSVHSGRWRRMRPIPTESGHWKVNLAPAHSPGEKVPEYVHRLVALAFLGDPNPPDPDFPDTPEGRRARRDYVRPFEVCHDDDDKSNNRLDNLYWGTRSDNNQDAARNRSIRGV